MERREEVAETLGEECLELLLDEVRTGRLKMPEIQMMAQLMQGTVYGKFVEMENKRASPEKVMMFMLDVWNNEGNDGREELLDILINKSVAQLGLARKIRETTGTNIETQETETESTKTSTTSSQSKQGGQTVIRARNVIQAQNSSFSNFSMN